MLLHFENDDVLERSEVAASCNPPTGRDHAEISANTPQVVGSSEHLAVRSRTRAMWGFGAKRSELGQRKYSAANSYFSAPHPITDIARTRHNVGLVPMPEIVNQRGRGGPFN